MDHYQLEFLFSFAFKIENTFFTKCVHFLITAFVNENSREITTLVITELWKCYNACTKILTTFTLNNN